MNTYRYTWQTPDKLSITLEEPSGSYQTERRQLQLEVHLPFPASQPQPIVRRVVLDNAPLAEQPAPDGWQARATRSEMVVTLLLNETAEARTLEIILS